MEEGDDDKRGAVEGENPIYAVRCLAAPPLPRPPPPPARTPRRSPPPCPPNAVWAPPLQKEVDKIKSFLYDFETPAVGRAQGMLKYAQAIAEIKAKTRKVLDVELDDVALSMPQEFLRSVEGNTRRYVELFYEAVDAILLESRQQADVIEEDDGTDAMLRAHRLRQHQEILRDAGEEPADLAEIYKKFPPQLLRTYELRVMPRTTEKPLSLRQVAGSALGRLVSIKAIVLRATDVRPMLQVASYSWCVCARASVRARAHVCPPTPFPAHAHPHSTPFLRTPATPPPPPTHPSAQRQVRL
jgi:hypothetical protein